MDPPKRGLQIMRDYICKVLQLLICLFKLVKQLYDESEAAQEELRRERDELLMENERLRVELAGRRPSLFNAVTYAVLGDET